MDGLLPRHALPRLGALAATLLLALAVLAAPARADGASPAARWPVGGPALRTAMDLAAGHWGMTPCAGRVALRWAPLPGTINAQSSWANDVDPYLQPSRNTECDIALNVAQDWDWPMLCTVMVHEVGHLTGHDHVDDPDDVMSASYVAPVQECVATPAPPEGGAPAPATAAKTTAAAPRTAAKAKTPKRAATKAKKARRRAPARRAAHRHR